MGRRVAVEGRADGGSIMASIPSAGGSVRIKTEGTKAPEMMGVGRDGRMGGGVQGPCDLYRLLFFAVVYASPSNGDGCGACLHSVSQPPVAARLITRAQLHKG